MLSRKVERSLPYSAEQMFDLAADVERYPEFLQWWITARSQQRKGAIFYTNQVLGLGPIRVRFNSKTVLHRPRRIDVTSDEPPFQQFKLSWTFEPRPGAGCRVGLVAEIEFESGLLQKIANRVLSGAIADIIAAFEARAHLLYPHAERSKNAPMS